MFLQYRYFCDVVFLRPEGQVDLHSIGVIFHLEKDGKFAGHVDLKKRRLIAM